MNLPVEQNPTFTIGPLYRWIMHQLSPHSFGHFLLLQTTLNSKNSMKDEFEAGFQGLLLMPQFRLVTHKISCNKVFWQEYSFTLENKVNVSKAIQVVLYFRTGYYRGKSSRTWGRIKREIILESLCSHK